MKALFHGCCVVGAVVASGWTASLHAAPGHPHPYLMPPAEKQRLLERIRTSDLEVGAPRRIEASIPRHRCHGFNTATAVAP